jgi:alkaline phosphatase D
VRPCLPLALALCLLSPARAADADKKAISRIAFGSCLHQDRPQPIWAPLLATKPELFLFLGDNIYADTEDVAEMRKMYAQLGAQPGYKKLLKACPVLATWDDHDYGKDDAGVEYPKKKESQQAFLDFFGVAKDSPRRKREGVYHAEVFGPVGKRVQVILLDMRYHRSKPKKDLKLPRNKGQYVPNTDEGATLLGASQWQWLSKQLEVPAEVRLICSGIQVVAQDHGFEKPRNALSELSQVVTRKSLAINSI